MKIDLKTKRKLENYIRSIVVMKQLALNWKVIEPLLIELLLIVTNKMKRKNLVSLIDIIEVTSKDGKYEEIGLRQGRNDWD